MRQGNVFTPVCHTFCSQGGGGLYQGDRRPPPPTEVTPGQRPPWTDTPWIETPRQRPPWTQTPWRETPPTETSRTETPLDRDPPAAQRVMSGRYASYWNAFLFEKKLEDTRPFCGPIDTSVGLLVTSALVSKTGWTPLVCFVACMQQNPQIHISCNTWFSSTYLWTSIGGAWDRILLCFTRTHDSILLVSMWNENDEVLEYLYWITLVYLNIKLSLNIRSQLLLNELKYICPVAQMLSK